LLPVSAVISLLSFISLFCILVDHAAKLLSAEANSASNFSGMGNER